MSRYTLLCPSCGGKLDAKTAPILNPSSYCCPLELLAILGSLLILLVLSFIQGLAWPARLELRPPTDSSLRLPKSRGE